MNIKFTLWLILTSWTGRDVTIPYSHEYFPRDQTMISLYQQVEAFQDTLFIYSEIHVEECIVSNNPSTCSVTKTPSGRLTMY